jgi:hypothetical protein
MVKSRFHFSMLWRIVLFHVTIWKRHQRLLVLYGRIAAVMSSHESSRHKSTNNCEAHQDSRFPWMWPFGNVTSIYSYCMAASQQSWVMSHLGIKAPIIVKHTKTPGFNGCDHLETSPASTRTVWPPSSSHESSRNKSTNNCEAHQYSRLSNAVIKDR